MKKNFVRVMLFGALALSTVTYVGCKDYDDDIDNLQTQINANAEGLAALQAKINAGNWVTEVTPITGGFKITFNNGSSYSIVNGEDGKKGEDGAIAEIGQNGNWFIGGVDTGKPSRGEKGETGAQGPAGETGPQGPLGPQGPAGPSGKSPFIADGKTEGFEKGYWYFYDDATNKWVKGDYSSTTIYISQDPESPCYILHIKDEVGKDKEITLPIAGLISSMKGVKIVNNVLSTDGTAEVVLKYGTTDKKIEFHNVPYGEDGYLISSNAVVNALINPVDIDFADAKYQIVLTDSKGNSVFKISDIKQNKSVKPLQTRATTEPVSPSVNKGIYDLTIALNPKSSKEDVLAAADDIAYALSTTDAWGNEIISDYDIKVKTEKAISEPSFSSGTTPTGTIGDNLELDKLAAAAGFKADEVVAYYYELADATPAPKDVTLDEGNKTIKSTKGQTVKVNVCYLTMTGKIFDGKERDGVINNPYSFDIKFTQTVDVAFNTEDKPFKFDWVAATPSSLTQQTLALTDAQMKPILDAVTAAGGTYASLTEFKNDPLADAFIDVNTSDENKLTIKIKKGFKGTALAELEIDASSVVTIKVVAYVSVSYMSNVDLTHSILWDANNKVGLPIKYEPTSSDKLQAVKLGLELPTLFEKYDDMKDKVVALGGVIEHVATPEAIASSITGENFEFDAKDYTGGAITVTSQVKYGEDAVGENNIATFILRNPTLLAGTLTVPSAKEAAHEITNTSEDTRKEPVNLTTGFKWLDGRSTKDKEIQMWPTLATEEDGTTVKYYAAGTTSKGALAMYGLKVTYAFDDKDADTKKYKGYFDAIDQEAGTVKLTDEAAGYPTIGQDINVRIIATATCPWMDLGDKKETVLTVTVKAW